MESSVKQELDKSGGMSGAGFGDEKNVPNAGKSKLSVFMKFLFFAAVILISVYAANTFFQVDSRQEDQVFSKISKTFPSSTLAAAVKGDVIVNEQSAADMTSGQPQSEHYRALEIKFGGSAVSSEDSSATVLDITDVRSESFLTKDQKESKIVITWKTSKMANSSLVFSKNNAQTEKTIRESGYGYTHSVIIAQLDPATAYTFLIRCTDRWGNQKETNRFGFYSGTKNVSVFELIAQAFGDIFKWAVKK